MIPYWLDEPAPPLPPRLLDGPADVVVVGGGVTGCSAALTLAAARLARPPPRGARDRRWRQRTKRRVRAARRARAVRRHVGDDRRGCRACVLALDRGRDPDDARGSPVTASGTPAASGSRSTTRSATSSDASTRRCARQAWPRTGSTIRCPRSPAASPARSSIPPTACCNPPAGCAGSPPSRRTPVSRSTSTAASNLSTTSTPRPCWSAPTAIRAGCSASSRG